MEEPKGSQMAQTRAGDRRSVRAEVFEVLESGKAFEPSIGPTGGAAQVEHRQARQARAGAIGLRRLPCIRKSEVLSAGTYRLGGATRHQ